MELIDKEVYFHKYCKYCQFGTQDESADPCWDCLQYPSNTESHKPVYFRPKDGMSMDDILKKIKEEDKENA